MAHGPSRSAACGIFPDQGSNPCPLHWQADSQPLHHQGSPGTSVLIRDPTWLPSPFCHGRMQQEVCNPEESLHPTMWISNHSGLPASKTWELHFCGLKATQSVVLCYSSPNRHWQSLSFSEIKLNVNIGILGKIYHLFLVSPLFLNLPLCLKFSTSIGIKCCIFMIPLDFTIFTRVTKTFTLIPPSFLLSLDLLISLVWYFKPILTTLHFYCLV